MQWLYLDADQQQVPVDEGDLGTLLQNGTIAAGTLLWNESMPEWENAQTLWPDWFPASPAGAEPAPASRPVLVAGKAPAIGMVKRPIKTAGGSSTQRSSGGILGRATTRTAEPEGEGDRALVGDLASCLSVNAGWMKFVGVLMIINGVATCLTVVGAVIGWLPIWLGVVLNRASDAARSAAGSGLRSDLEEALERTGFYFKLTGIFFLVYLIINVVIVVFVVSSGVVGLLLGGAAMEGMESPLPPPDFNQ